MPKAEVVKAIKDRMLLFPVTLVEVLVCSIILKVVTPEGQSVQNTLAQTPKVIILMTLVIAILVPFLILFIYKHKKLKEYILKSEPNFYETREFDKWFDYYTKNDK